MTFKEIIVHLGTIKVKYEEEYLWLMFLCLLPISYVTFKDTILYSLDTLVRKNVSGVLVKFQQSHIVKTREVTRLYISLYSIT